MLELMNVHNSFGDIRVLDGVNLRLQKGCVYTLKRGNGSGTKTLINIISIFLKLDEGTMKFKVNRISSFLTFRVNKMSISKTFQDLRITSKMTDYGSVLFFLKKRMLAFHSKYQLNRVYGIIKKVLLIKKDRIDESDISLTCLTERL